MLKSNIVTFFLVLALIMGVLLGSALVMVMGGCHRPHGYQFASATPAFRELNI